MQPLSNFLLMKIEKNETNKELQCMNPQRHVDAHNTSMGINRVQSKSTCIRGFFLSSWLRNIPELVLTSLLIP